MIWFKEQNPKYRMVQGECPNVGHPCNCPGYCQPIYVLKDDPRTDEQIRRESNLLRMKAMVWTWPGR